jgi:uncharacterized protein
MESIIAEAKFCRMAFCDEGTPYVVPLCFGYESRTVYVHSAREGRKLEILRKNGKVCLEFGTIPAIVLGGDACGWDIRYKSVIAGGTAVLLDENESKRRALAVIMKNYASGGFEFSDDALDKTIVIRVGIETMTCKISS